MSAYPRLFVVSGPSGAGKGTLVAKVRSMCPSLGLTVSVTTRSPRPGEIDGISYFFVDDERFDRLISEGAFLEWAKTFNHRYGTLKSEVERNFCAGKSLILEIDVKGGHAIKAQMPECVLVFIEPPSHEELVSRLKNRGSEDEESIALRLSIAEEERKSAEDYDVFIVNDDLDKAADELLDVIKNFHTVKD